MYTDEQTMGQPLAAELISLSSSGVEVTTVIIFPQHRNTLGSIIIMSCC